MIDCNKFYRLISEFIDEELEETVVYEIREHIRICAKCQSLHQSFLHIIKICQCQCALEVPETIHEELWKTLRGILEENID